ncbi:hypothetical protein FRC12_015571 [Ceratobasidium sp. 428]|nr:hypothetical protein FRC12_015571 [Ceratobasidium sp. 428]
MDELDSWMGDQDPWIGLEEGLFGMTAEEVRRTDEAQVQALLKDKEKRGRDNAQALASTVATVGSPDVDVAALAVELPSKRKQGSTAFNLADLSPTPKKPRHSFRQALLREPTSSIITSQEKKHRPVSSGMAQPQLDSKPKAKIRSNQNPFNLDASPRDGSKYECAVVVTSPSSPSRSRRASNSVQ